jgi:hypothetical protein
MKIKIIHDDSKGSLARSLPEKWNSVGGIELIRTRGYETDDVFGCCPAKCYICNQPMGDEPGWKTMFHGTCYHERCLTIEKE